MTSFVTGQVQYPPNLTDMLWVNAPVGSGTSASVTVGELLNQNGAPLRLVVPWKYGFKSIKSIVRIRLLEKEPPTTWSTSWPAAYGFYSNVNPNREHPRFSQKEEERLGEGSVFSPKVIKTQMFNGYAAQVAKLYDGMNLIRSY